MRSERNIDGHARVLLAGGLLAGVGLAAGYFGPICLNPYSNLGPLVSIFFTGPLGLAAGLISGLVLGFVADVRHWTASHFVASLAVAGAAVVGLAFFISLPDDLWRADLIEGTVVACTAPSQFEGTVISQWADSIAINPEKQVAVTWQNDIRNVLAGSRDMVADIQLTAKSAVYQGRRPWNKGRLYFQREPLPSTRERYVVPAGLCQPGRRLGRRMARWPVNVGFPPNTAAALLNFPELQPVPPDISALATE